jgi:hypothetical protein
MYMERRFGLLPTLLYKGVPIQNYSSLHSSHIKQNTSASKEYWMNHWQSNQLMSKYPMSNTGKDQTMAHYTKLLGMCENQSRVGTDFKNQTVSKC